MEPQTLRGPRPFGGTGIAVSALGFGASPLGGVFGPVTQAQADAAVWAAVEAGIALFDTAPFYGLGRSETVLGRALSGIPRDRYVLSTKVGRYGVEAFDYSATRIARSVDESLERLNVSHVDLLVCHDIEYGDPDQIVEEALPAMRRIVEAGKARAIGISGLPLGIFPEIVDRAPIDFVLTYCHGTLQDATATALVPDWKARGIGVINASPLGMGLLTDDGPPAWHPAPEAVKAACAAAASHCRSRGARLSALALAWASRLPGIDVTLVGMADAATVAENVAAADQTPDPELLAEVAAILAPVQGVGWPSGRWGN